MSRVFCVVELASGFVRKSFLFCVVETLGCVVELTIGVVRNSFLVCAVELLLCAVGGA